MAEKKVTYTTTTTTSTTTDAHHHHGGTSHIGQEGNLPSNQRIHSELESTKHFLDSHTHHGDVKHQQVVADTRALVDTVQETLHTKNQGDKIQRLIRDIQRIQISSEKGHGSAISGEMMEFLKALRDFITSLVKSASFRTILLDTVKLVREIVSYHRPSGLSSGLKQDFLEQKRPMKESVKETVEEVKYSFRETKWEDLNEEHRIRIRHQFSTLLKELSSHPSASKAFRRLLHLVSLLQSSFFTHYEKQRSNRNVQKVQVEAKEIVEEFIGGQSLENLLNHIRTAILLIEADQEAQFQLRAVRVHIEKGLDDPAYASSEEYLKITETLLRNTNYLINKYSSQRVFYDIIDETERILDTLRNDTQLQLLSHRARRVMKDFTYTDSKTGRTRLDTDVIGHMKSLIVPFLIERVREIPIPRVETQAEGFDYIIVDKIFLTISDIIPDDVKIKMYNNVSLDVTSIATGASHSQLEVKVFGVRPIIKDFYFAFKRNKLPALKDEGHADLVFRRTGLNLTVIFDVKTDTHHTVTLVSNKVSVYIDKMKISVREAHHKALLNMVTTVFGGMIERQIQKAMEEKLLALSRDMAERLNTQVLPKIKDPLTKLKTTVQERVGR